MNFFDKILGGSIPINVVETIENTKPFNFKEFNYLKINEGMTNELGYAPINMTNLLNSEYGSHINASLNLNRDQIHDGLYKLLNAATNDALNNNRDKLKSLINLNESDKDIDKVIRQFSHDLSNSIILLINGSNMNENARNIFTNIIHLTGITNKTIDQLRDIEKRVILDLELPNDYKNKTRIHIHETLKRKLTPSNIKKCEKALLHKCVFDNDFLLNLSNALLVSLETILENIMNLTKYNEICNFYAFSVEMSNHIATVNVPQPKTPRSSKRIKSLKKGNAKVVEKFAVNIGNQTINVDSTKVKDIQKIEKNIDQSKVVSGMNKMLSSAINKAASKNQADLIKAIAASNKISIGKVKGDSFTLSNINQTAKVDTTTEANFVQEIANKIINDISVSLKQNVEMVQKDVLKDMNKTTVNEKSGTTVGDIITGVAGVAGAAVGAIADTAKDIMTVNIGNKTENRKEKDISKEMSEKFNLNQSFQFKDDNDVKNQLENILSSENLAKCAEDTKTANEVNLGEINVTGAVTISNLKQEAIVNSMMKCMFNQKVLNEIANKIVNSQEKLIKQLIENVKEYKNETDRQKVQGDLYAAGTAASAIIASAGTAVSEAAKGVGEGVGTAAKGVGEGVGTAAKGVGEGVGKAAEGVGKGVGSALEGVGKGLLGPLKTPLIIAAVGLVIGGIAYFFMKKKPEGDGDGDAEGEE